MKAPRAWDRVNKFMFGVDTLSWQAGGLYVSGPGIGDGYAQVNEAFKGSCDVTIELLWPTGLDAKVGGEAYGHDVVSLPRSEVLWEVYWQGDLGEWLLAPSGNKREPDKAKKGVFIRMGTILGSALEHPELLESRIKKCARCDSEFMYSGREPDVCGSCDDDLREQGKEAQG